jgi:D-sedoheptulose 7-phosphate isomerase
VQETRVTPAAAADLEFLEARVAERVRSGEEFFAANAAAIAACASAMADRFFAGSTLLVLGTGPHATDAAHNSVEFVHPVLPGCRALPAISLSNDVATVTGLLHSEAAVEVYAHQLRVLGRKGDIALAFACEPLQESVLRGLRAARERGMLTVALTSGPNPAPKGLADYTFHAVDPDLLHAHELHLATYHMLWELAHIVLNHRGIGDVGDTAAYPQEGDLS